MLNGPLSFDSRNSLEKLFIKDCQHSQSLFKCNINLCNLKRLEIDDCEGLEYIIDEIIDDNEISMFQKLEVLSIKKCPRIELILPFLSAHDLPALESITIKSCDKLNTYLAKMSNLVP